jgi:DNA-binding transcriptional regulator GbsR (MarR family)
MGRENPDGEASAGVERRVLQVCNAFGTLVEYWGFKSINGRVWVLLALQDRPMAQARIAETLGVSRSLVSGTITELAGFGVVRPAGDHRNAPYEAVLDIWPAVTDTLRAREWMLLESARLTLDGALEEVKLGPRGPYSARRITLLLSMVAAIQKLLSLLMSIRQPRAVASVKEWVKSVIGLIDSLRGLR